jgi:MoxR-like ATPase
LAGNNGEKNQLPRKILNEISKVIIGKEELKEALLVALIANGHVLIEGVPGTAKTKLGHAFAIAIGGQFKRLQLTPDTLPADITGFYLYRPSGEPRFIQGPIFCNVVLADELNRTTPRTQSALLEAMGEYRVSIEGVTHNLARPFMVIATQVSFGAEGTYPLTDVQSDRFLLRALSRYPNRAEEKTVVSNIDHLDETSLSQVVDIAQIEEIQRQVQGIHVSEPILDYIMDIIETLRRDPDLADGPSPRGSIALFKCARAHALLEERDFVIPDDVKRYALPGLSHRIRVKPEAEMEGITPELLIERALSQVTVPKVEA